MEKLTKEEHVKGLVFAGGFASLAEKAGCLDAAIQLSSMWV